MLRVEQKCAEITEKLKEYIESSYDELTPEFIIFSSEFCSYRKKIPRPVPVLLPIIHVYELSPFENVQPLRMHRTRKHIQRPTNRKTIWQMLGHEGVRPLCPSPFAPWGALMGNHLRLATKEAPSNEKRANKRARGVILSGIKKKRTEWIFSHFSELSISTISAKSVQKWNRERIRGHEGSF